MKKKIMLLVLTVLMSTILSGIAVMAYVRPNGSTLVATATPASNTVSAQCVRENESIMIPRAWGGMRGWPHGWEHGGFVEVSEEFKDKVINITKDDPDVQGLLADGYNITGVRPIIKARVEANGDVSIKATSAIVTLRKDTTGKASVWVNVEEGKVTRIEILTRTVIEKPQTR